MSDLGLILERLLHELEPDRRIGPFVLVRQLGRGGFAPVWLANETFGGEILRAAAVKIFALDERDPSASRRIIAEASALCRVEHPNVVRFYSLALEEDLGLLGLGMEFVAGRSVATRLEQAGLMRHDQVVDLGLAMAFALEAVHQAGIVHRDIKPANIMETDQGYKLVDFGISMTATVFPDASNPAPNDPNSTGRVAGMQSGTLGYVDPVMMASGVPASPTSDLYALGVTLFECLTGRLPSSVDRKTFDQTILDGRKPPPRVADCAKNVPPGLAAIIDKLVSPDRSQRFTSTDEVIEAFERLYKIPAPAPSPLPVEMPLVPQAKRSFSPAQWFLPVAVAVLFGAYGVSAERSKTRPNIANAHVNVEMVRGFAANAKFVDSEKKVEPPVDDVRQSVPPNKPSARKPSPFALPKVTNPKPDAERKTPAPPPPVEPPPAEQPRADSRTPEMARSSMKPPLDGLEWP